MKYLLFFFILSFYMFGEIFFRSLRLNYIANRLERRFAKRWCVRNNIR